MIAIALCLALSGGDVHHLATRHHFTWTHDGRTGLHVIKAGDVTMSFMAGSKVARVDGKSMKLLVPVQSLGGRVIVPHQRRSPRYQV